MERRLPFRSSFRAQFNLTVAAVYLVATLGTLSAFTFAMQSLLSNFAARITVKEALLQRNKAAALIDRELALAQTLASDPIIRRWVLDESDPQRKTLAFEQLTNYRNAFRDQSYFIAVAASGDYYLDNRAHGAQTMDGTHLTPTNPANAWFYRSLRNERGYELNLDYDMTTGATKVWLNVVIRDSAGQAIGLGGSGIDISDFIVSLATPTEKGLLTLLTDPNGVITMSQDRSLVERNAKIRDQASRTNIDSMVQTPADREVLRQAIETASAGDEHVAAFPVNLTTGKAMVAVSVLPGTGWRNVVILDLAGIMTSRVFLPEITIVVVSLLAVLATISVFINRRVLRPLIALTRATRLMAEGRYDVALPVGRADEIGQLAGSFNAMAATVLDHTQNLERKVAERTGELSATNAELSQSRASIMESLRYARAIQVTLLPQPQDLAEAFSDHLILYRPRDLVGGDLIVLRRDDDTVLCGVLDCTGHGVPGAFMTMTAHSLFHQAASGLPADDPAAVLAELDRLLRQAYRLDAMSSGIVDCGLEAALCCCKKGQDQVVFAGAHLSLFVVEAGEVREVQGDRRRIGYRGHAARSDFTNRIIAAGPRTRFFATTDGVLDMAGGHRGFGFGVERLRAVLAAGSGDSLSAVGSALEAALNAYTDGRAQRDDIAVLGFCLEQERP